MLSVRDSMRANILRYCIRVFEDLRGGGDGSNIAFRVYSGSADQLYSVPPSLYGAMTCVGRARR